jgi:transglutaminase-like putative cysteine protease
MRFAVNHRTTYRYSNAVRLQPHVFRLRPRSNGTLQLLEFALQIDPAPIQFSECIDLEGNCVGHAWFDGLTDHLCIRSSFEIETQRVNAFDYLLGRDAQTLPLRYPKDLESRIAPYCSRETDNDNVADFARHIAELARGSTLDFLKLLGAQVHRDCAKIVREEGPPQPAGVTLRQRRGSCRDLALLFMDACRVFNIGARFVSGYQRYGQDPKRRSMHAWAEVYLPGGGWRGYDPTHATAVADAHVAVAACREPAGAAPIEGGFTGPQVSSTMEVSLEIF